MAIQSLLYISESRLKPGNEMGEVRRIVSAAQMFNPSAGVTGALLFTGTHFAQVIEGNEASVSRLMASIIRDSRHSDVKIVARDSQIERRFPGWSMAYEGPSQYVAGYVTRLLTSTSPSDSRRAAEWLAELLEQFSGYKGAALGGVPAL